MKRKKVLITLAIMLAGGTLLFLELSTLYNNKLNIRTNMIQQITLTGGAPRKVLLPQNDSQTIDKIVRLLNSPDSVRKSTPKELGYFGLMGHARFLNIKLQDGTTMDLFPMLIWTEVVVPNGRGFTGTEIPDQTIIRLDQNGNATCYTVKSKLIADYVAQGSIYDMPLIRK